MNRSLHLPAEHDALRRIRPWLSASNALRGVDELTLGRLELCIHEVASNIVDHSGASELSIEVERTTDGLDVRLTDDGERAELAVSLECHPRIGGYGLLIADQLATALSYDRTADGNVWLVQFALAP